MDRDQLEAAAVEARAALGGCRELLGDIANIQHAIDLLDAALAKPPDSPYPGLLAFLMSPLPADREINICWGVDALPPGRVDFSRFTDRLRKTFQLANQEAQLHNHEYVGVGHLLIAFVREGHGIASLILRRLGVDSPHMREKFLEREKPGPRMVTMGRLPRTPRVKQSCDRAVEIARKAGCDYVGTEHMLLGMSRDEGALWLLADVLGKPAAEVAEMIQVAYSETVGNPSRLLCEALKSKVPDVVLHHLQEGEELLLELPKNHLETVASWRRLQFGSSQTFFAVRWKTREPDPAMRQASLEAYDRGEFQTSAEMLTGIQARMDAMVGPDEPLPAARTPVVLDECNATTPPEPDQPKAKSWRDEPPML